MKPSIRYVLILAIPASLCGCPAPQSVEDCEAIAEVDSRLNCLNDAMYGNVLRGAEIGTVAGGILGAGIGFLEGGPRGSVIGAVSGAGIGGLTGGAAAYFQYNEARSDGDAHVMYSNALADIEAENRQEGVLIDSYEDDLSQLNTEIVSLKQQIAAARSDASQEASLVDQIRSAYLDIQTQQGALQKTIPAQMNVVVNSGKYFVNTPSDSDEWIGVHQGLSNNSQTFKLIYGKYSELGQNLSRVFVEIGIPQPSVSTNQNPPG